MISPDPLFTGVTPFVRHNLAAAVEAHLRRAIEEGHFPLHLPGERRLAQWYGVSRPVLRQALAPLIAEGIIRQHRGRRTAVHPDRIRETPLPAGGLPRRA